MPSITPEYGSFNNFNIVFVAQYYKSTNQNLINGSNDITTKDLNAMRDAKMGKVEPQKPKEPTAKDILTSIEKKQIVFDKVVADKLGHMYPEGVSQDKYSQNDKNGILEASVT